MVGIVAITAFSAVRSRRRGGRHVETPLETARRLYARGEITREDLDRAERDEES